MVRRFFVICIACLAVDGLPAFAWAQQEENAADKDTSETDFVNVDVSSEPEVSWPYQEPLFALSALTQSRVRIGMGFANNPDLNSLAFSLGGSFAFWDMAVYLKMPIGLAMNDEMGNSFNFGDLEFGVKWLISHEEKSQKHLTVGLSFTAPLSRVGEEKDLAGVQRGEIADDSNFGKRYLLAQKPILDMGLIPKLNVGLTPYVAFGQNIGRVSLQTDFGCLILLMDNVDEQIYGTDRRYGFVLFFDLAAPVAITQELSIVAEFNASVALDGLLGTGFAFTIGPRYTVNGFSAGIGIQLPVGVDNKPPDDDKMIGRYDSAIVARHHIAAILDLSYSF
ncbi:MAG TPA: hypothetical protein VM425_21640 [Myxococcota bacterium]|nr:hypothetical protein [Myxococcota bacterium]